MRVQRVALSGLGLLLLASISVAAGQTKKPVKNGITKNKPVTITLVRWPYT